MILPGVDETLVSEFPKDAATVVRVRKLVVDGVELLDIRDYNAELELYGRGAMLPAHLKKALVSALKGA